MTGSIEILVDGRAVRVTPGATLAAALANAGLHVLRVSVGGEPRGALCGMGICQECRLTVDGVRHRRACMTFVTGGMIVERESSDA
jgi:D-hydroxyproline dehydrogenase subunit gamma